MSRFESIVRPFQSRDVTPTTQNSTVNPHPPKSTQPAEIVQIGRQGATKVFNGSDNATYTFYIDAKLKETGISYTWRKIDPPARRNAAGGAVP